MEHSNQLSTTKVRVVNSITEVQDQVLYFQREGYTSENIFVLTHDQDRTSRIVKKTDASAIGIAEEGVGTAIANMFRSTGDELRAKMRSLGISPYDAQRLESEMDHDKVLVIAWSGKEYTGNDYDPTIYYYTYM